jgi:hypothetical protein
MVRSQSTVVWKEGYQPLGAAAVGSITVNIQCDYQRYRVDTNNDTVLAADTRNWGEVKNSKGVYMFGLPDTTTAKMVRTAACGCQVCDPGTGVQRLADAGSVARSQMGARCKGIKRKGGIKFSSAGSSPRRCWVEFTSPELAAEAVSRSPYRFGDVLVGCDFQRENVAVASGSGGRGTAPNKKEGAFTASRNRKRTLPSGKLGRSDGRPKRAKDDNYSYHNGGGGGRRGGGGSGGSGCSANSGGMGDSTTGDSRATKQP